MYVSPDTKKYSQRLLAHVDDVNAKYPWPKRQPLLFGRFSYYYRHVHPNVSETWRWVVGGGGRVHAASVRTNARRLA
jgi:hypothetical protein